MNYTKCVCCNLPFTSQNVYSRAGWKETQISGMCEKCFDEACYFPEEDEDIPVDHTDYE